MVYQRFNKQHVDAGKKEWGVNLRIMYPFKELGGVEGF